MADLFSDDAPSAPTGGKQEKRRSSGVVFGLVILGLGVVVGGGWAAAYYLADDKVPNNTSVAGVEISNLEASDAHTALAKAIGDRMIQPVAITVGGESTTITPAKAGLTFDATATMAELDFGRSWNPIDLWNHYTGGAKVDPVIAIDKVAFAGAIDEVNEKVGKAPVDGGVSFADGAVKVSEPEIGQGAEPEAFEAALRKAAVESGDRSIALTMTDLEPEIDEADVQKAVNEFANPAMSGPVTLTFGKSPVKFDTAQIGSMVALKAEGGELVPSVKSKAFSAVLNSRLAKRADAPVDATVTLRGGKPVVVPAKPGVSFDPVQAERAFLTAVGGAEGARSTEIEATVAEPEISTADAEAWQIKEKISSFTTYFPYAEYRNVNIGRGAEIVNGTVLKPGETFSLNGTIGERTRANGFTEGWTIQEGVFKSDLGGGVSQVATTVFNAGYFGGMEDVEHHAHSLYISRYPVGREATVAWGAKDLQFKNNTEYGVYIRAAVSPAAPGRQGSITVSLWSTKIWDVTSTTGSRYGFTEFGSRRIVSDNCDPMVGAPGFSIDVTRYFTKPGESKPTKSEKMTTRYIPQDNVTCVSPAAEATRKADAAKAESAKKD